MRWSERRTLARDAKTMIPRSRTRFRTIDGRGGTEKSIDVKPSVGAVYEYSEREHGTARVEQASGRTRSDRESK